MSTKIIETTCEDCSGEGWYWVANWPYNTEVKEECENCRGEGTVEVEVCAECGGPLETDEYGSYCPNCWVDPVEIETEVCPACGGPVHIITHEQNGEVAYCHACNWAVADGYPVKIY